MNDTFASNAGSRAWEQLTQLFALPNQELVAKYGVEHPWIEGSLNPTERRLVAVGFGLIVNFEPGSNEIVASIVNETRRGFPKRRKFAIVGDKDNPLLVEDRGSPMDATALFGELVLWLHAQHATARD